MDGDGRGGEGGGVFDIFGGGGAGGGDGGGGGGDVGGGWRRASSARGRIPAAGEANPAAGTRHEESNLEPRQLGAAGADHHRGRGAQPPCQAAPPHRQTGQATAERAAQRRQPNGGVRPGGPTADSLICAADLPNSGTAPPMVQPESPAALLTCLGRHTAARPPAADGPPAYPESGPADPPAHRRFGCPEPCTRQANPPEHQGPISDFQASKRARCAGRPDFGLGGRRPQVQNLGRDRLRPFGRGRGWGKVSRPPPWKRANLATRRARGGAMACSAVGRRTGRDPRIMRVTCSFPPLPFPVTLCSSHSIVAVARFVSSEFVSSNSRSDLCDALACAPPLSRRTGEHTRIWYPRRDPGGARSLACLRAGTVPYTRVESNIQKKNVWC